MNFFGVVSSNLLFLPPNFEKYFFPLDPKDHITGFAHNRARGGGFYFGKHVTDNFLQSNNLQLLIRSHEVVPNGYALHHDGRCVTIFSAPNYFNRNLAAVVRFSGETEELKPQIRQFKGMGREDPLLYGLLGHA